MASLMDYVLQTLPFIALEATLRGKRGRTSTPALRLSSPDEVARHLTFLEPGEVCTLPPAPMPDPIPSNLPACESQHQALPIWSFNYWGDPSRLDQLVCRVWGEGYNRYEVLERLAFGIEEPVDSYRPEVLAYPTVGPGESAPPIALPLTTEFLRQTWLVEDAFLPRLTDKWWPIQERVDKALVNVFVYEFAKGSTVPLPLKGAPSEEASFAKAAAAYRKINAEGGFDAQVLEDLFADSTFFPGDLGTGVGAATGEEAATETGLSRVVVMLTWTLSKACFDYAPVPIAMARVHPVAQIVASNAHSAFELSIQFDRPKQTKNLDRPGQCCPSSKGEMLPDMSSVLVTETNWEDSIFMTAAWSSLFSYYRSNPTKPWTAPSSSKATNKTEKALTKTPLHVIRTDTGSRPAAAPMNGTTPYIERIFSPMTRSGPYTGLIKYPRQGEFDNVHFAPPMRCHRAQQISRLGAVPVVPSIDYFGPLQPLSQYPEIAASMEAINMAPFCAHDCFHMHWRWADYYHLDKNKWLAGMPGPQWKGWGPSGPHTEIGVAQAPLNQSVLLWYRDAHLITYHAFMGNHTIDGRFGEPTIAEAQRDIMPGEMQYVCHHGAAYGLNADHYLASLASGGSGDQLEVESAFFGAAGKSDRISAATNSWALLYWRFRYRAEWDDQAQKFTLIERTTFHDLTAARHFKC